MAVPQRPPTTPGTPAERLQEALEKLVEGHTLAVEATRLLEPSEALSWGDLGTEGVRERRLVLFHAHSLIAKYGSLWRLLNRPDPTWLAGVRRREPAPREVQGELETATRDEHDQSHRQDSCQEGGSVA